MADAKVRRMVRDIMMPRTAGYRTALLLAPPPSEPSEAGSQALGEGVSGSVSDVRLCESCNQTWTPRRDPDTGYPICDGCWHE